MYLRRRANSPDLKSIKQERDKQKTILRVLKDAFPNTAVLIKDSLEDPITIRQNETRQPHQLTFFRTKTISETKKNHGGRGAKRRIRRETRGSSIL